MRQFAESPHRGTRKVIDVSGDGVNNSGRMSVDARDEALAAGITINGLVIMNDRPNPGPGSFRMPQPPLDEYYRAQVIGGPGAFVIAIEDFTSFAYAIVSKLIREIAEAPPRDRRSRTLALNYATPAPSEPNTHRSSKAIRKRRYPQRSRKLFDIFTSARGLRRACRRVFRCTITKKEKKKRGRK
jgi:hypothetical protein